MARKTKAVTIEAEGRDKGKTYLLTEMPVHQAEKWAARALLAISSAGGDVNPTEGTAGFGGSLFSSLSKVPWGTAEGLLDEMMGCIQFSPSLGIYRKLTEGQDDIEEVKTLFTLRKEILGLHFDFFTSAGS